LFHVGIALIALGGIGWWLRHGPFSESTGAAVPAVIQAKEVTANVERGPSQGQPVTLRRGEGVTVVKREDRAEATSSVTSSSMPISADARCSRAAPRQS